MGKISIQAYYQKKKKISIQAKGKRKTKLEKAQEYRPL